MKEIKDLQEKFDLAQSDNKKLVADIKALEFECDTLKNSNRRINSDEMKRQCKSPKFYISIILVSDLKFFFTVAQIEELQKNFNEIQTKNYELIAEKEALKSQFEKSNKLQNANLDLNVKDELKMKSKFLKI